MTGLSLAISSDWNEGRYRINFNQSITKQIMIKTITVEATILASAEKVWAYYTTPDHITKWNFADPSWHCPKVENDLRVGGKYLARMEAKDGSFGFDFEAVYKDVKKRKSFSYTMADGRVATTVFESDGKNTKVSVTFDPEEENSIEMQKEGWQSILNSFRTYAENH